MPTAASVFANLLADAGVRRAYTVPGESCLEILDAIEQHSDLSLVSVRHEGGAAFMAEAEAKLTGGLTVALGGRGVGATNLSIGIHTARQDSSPVIFIVGQVENQFLGREAFQELDLEAFLGPVAKWVTTLRSADRTAEIVQRAVRVATSGRPGPVVIGVPSGVLAEEIDVPAKTNWWSGRRESPAASQHEVEEFGRLLTRAQRPVLIVGGGCSGYEKELLDFVEAANVGVYAAFRRQDVFPNDHPNYLGHLTIGTPSEVVQTLSEADLVIVLGCRLSEITTQAYRFPRDDTPLVQIDIASESIGAVVNPDLGVVADSGQFLSQVLALGGSSGPIKERDWSTGHRAYMDSSEIQPVEMGTGIDSATVVKIMNDVIPSDAIITIDAGNFSAFLHQYRRFVFPRTQLAPTSGAMGYAVPAAIAAKLAEPHRTVVGVAGDGGFLMTGNELETAVRYMLDLTIIVFRNGLLGTIAMHQGRSFGRLSGSDIGSVDLAAFAEALGARGLTARSPDDLYPALEEALATVGPVVVDVITDSNRISPTTMLDSLLTGGRPRGAGSGA